MKVRGRASVRDVITLRPPSANGAKGRRRKIRCIFPPDNPNECTECFARGSRCIDQEHASADAIVDHRKNLRERVSRLESLVDSLMDEKSDRGAAETLRNLRGEFPVSPQSSEARSSSVADQSDRGPSLRPYDSDVVCPD